MVVLYVPTFCGNDISTCCHTISHNKKNREITIYHNLASGTMSKSIILPPFISLFLPCRFTDSTQEQKFDKIKTATCKYKIFWSRTVSVRKPSLDVTYRLVPKYVLNSLFTGTLLLYYFLKYHHSLYICKSITEYNESSRVEKLCLD